jgi:hypothetical protein
MPASPRRSAARPIISIPARELRIDDIVTDSDGTHEVTAIDLGDGAFMGVTMHGEDEFGEFVYGCDESVTIWKR